MNMTEQLGVWQNVEPFGHGRAGSFDRSLSSFPRDLQTDSPSACARLSKDFSFPLLVPAFVYHLVF